MPKDARYDPMEETPRHRRKHKRKRVRSDHKHDYELVCVDSSMFVRSGGETEHLYESAERCRVCGRVARYRFDQWRGEPPKGLRLFKTCYVTDTWHIPKETEVADGQED